ncbi:histidine kinase dimerization/phosphoacceptor domain -containing protein [Methanocella sp. MCL-LM]|uniref:PAS domain-containing sensor histidine kinase n=1 Tax=Methanocella sp. MCL-LM TaxID=3412035 RepID=UPI003C715179
MSLGKGKYNFNILKVKGYNLTFIVLIAIQLILLIFTTILFIYSIVSANLEIISVIGFVGLLLICLPVSTYLYITTQNITIRRIFLGLTLMILFNSISGILWFLVPVLINANFLIPIAMLMMVLGYFPLAFILLDTFISQKSQLAGVIKLLIFYINSTFILTSLYLILTHMPDYAGNNYSVVIYTAAVIGDVLIVSLSTVLFLINIPTQHRYIYSILFIFYSISFIGDTCELIKFMNIYSLPDISEIVYGCMFLFLIGALIAYLLSNIKFTTIEEVNKKLQDTTLVVEDLITQSPDPICMCDPAGNVLKTNNEFNKIMNIAGEEGKCINIFSYNFKTDSDITSMLQKAKSGKTVVIESVQIPHGEKFRYLSLKLYPTYSSDGNITSYILMGVDITDRKNAYELLEAKVNERTSELSILNNALQREISEHRIDEEKIKASLKEKEVLLKEIHHRVKNNMQVISSMLELQTAYVNDGQLIDIIRDCQNRIKSMALIHEKLYQSNNLAYVNFSVYISSLISNLLGSYRKKVNNVKITTDIEDISFNIDMAIPIGLLLNELITNALKHAFEEGAQGEIYISIKDQGSGQYKILVKDNGRGLPEDFDINNLKTLGLNIVNILIDQINGTLEVDSGKGAQFVITFQYNK